MEHGEVQNVSAHDSDSANRVKRSYRFPVEVAERLDRLAKAEGATATATLIRLINEADEVGSSSPTVALAEMRAQHAEQRCRDLEIENERIYAALATAQDTVKAAHTLQAKAEQRVDEAEARLAESKAAMLALPDPDAWKQKGLLDRLLRR